MSTTFHLNTDINALRPPSSKRRLASDAGVNSDAPPKKQKVSRAFRTTPEERKAILDCNQTFPRLSFIGLSEINRLQTPSIASIFAPGPIKNPPLKPVIYKIPKSCTYLEGNQYREYIERTETRSMGGVSVTLRARLIRQVLLAYKKFEPLKSETTSDGKVRFGSGSGHFFPNAEPEPRVRFRDSLNLNLNLAFGVQGVRYQFHKAAAFERRGLCAEQRWPPLFLRVPDGVALSALSEYNLRRGLRLTRKPTRRATGGDSWVVKISKRTPKVLDIGEVYWALNWGVVVNSSPNLRIDGKEQQFTKPEDYSTFHKRKHGEVANSQVARHRKDSCIKPPLMSRINPSGGTAKKEATLMVYGQEECAMRCRGDVGDFRKISHKSPTPRAGFGFGVRTRSNVFSKMLHPPEPEPPVAVQFGSVQVRTDFPNRTFPTLETTMTSPAIHQSLAVVPKNGNDRLPSAERTAAEITKVNEALRGFARWEVDFGKRVIRSTRCEGLTTNDDGICAACQKLAKDESLVHAINLKNREQENKFVYYIKIPMVTQVRIWCICAPSRRVMPNGHEMIAYYKLSKNIGLESPRLTRLVEPKRSSLFKPPGHSYAIYSANMKDTPLPNMTNITYHKWQKLIQITLQWKEPMVKKVEDTQGQENML
ncbi:hypothetical protein K438DRAFT_1934848 [Mycena galopus ATCC 62051]|nr:hypothetical protein K438DRAFT_1934848 [Mycena galopus ATCC 62051]